MSYPTGASDWFASEMQGRMVERRNIGRPPVDDVRRYPEPDERPHPRAHWDEIRGVWEVWDDTSQQWVELGTPLEGDHVGMAGSRGAASILVDDDEVGVLTPPVHPSRADDPDQPATGPPGPPSVEGPGGHQAGQVTPPPPAEPAGTPALGGETTDPARAAPHEPEAAPVPGPPPPPQVPPGFAIPESDLRYPEPPHRPDPHAQWDPVDGVWRSWDPERVAWVPWAPS